MPESVKRRGSSGPTIGATVSSSASCSGVAESAISLDHKDRTRGAPRSRGAAAGLQDGVRGGCSGIVAGVATCLVTGGAGFLGSHLCDELLARGNRVICVDNFETGSLNNIEHIRDPERFTYLGVDIIEPYFVEEPIDFIYHLASPASPCLLYTSDAADDLTRVD